MNRRISQLCGLWLIFFNQTAYTIESDQEAANSHNKIPIMETDVKISALDALSGTTEGLKSHFSEEVIVEEVVKKDVFLVLDNSGSMKKNDPDFLMIKAVSKFINQQGGSVQVGIVVFDQAVRVAVPLTELSISSRQLILSGVKNMDYQGQYTDSPAAIERAIYELKNNGRVDAKQYIVFITDGIVDTGVPEKDLEKSRWLSEYLAQDAADHDIKIFGIAFTKTKPVDFQLIQSIAQRTKGEYYRVLKAADLHRVFERINAAISRLPEPEPVSQSVVSLPEEQVESEAVLPTPVIIDTPVQQIARKEPIPFMIIIIAALILIIILLIILIMLRRHRRLKPSAPHYIQEAYVHDLRGNTDKQTYRLSTKPTMFCRMAGKGTEHMDYIIINKPTIGRYHALIEYQDYSYWIIDQGSINGTFVNDALVETKLRLKHGDRIRLHKYDFKFVIPEIEDSGMTVVSNTVFEAIPGEANIEATTHLQKQTDSGKLNQARRRTRHDKTETIAKAVSDDQIDFEDRTRMPEKM